MLYHNGNAAGSWVYDMDRIQRIDQVVTVDTDSGAIAFAPEPLRVAECGDRVHTEILRFRAIYPITGGAGRPCLFHCYGRLQ